MYDSDKYYRPILDDDEHLLESTKTPGRYRGLSRDYNNENPGIPEWEEVEFDDRSDSDFGAYAEAAVTVVELAILLAPIVKKYIIPFVKQLPILTIGGIDYSVLNTNENRIITTERVETEEENNFDKFILIKGGATDAA